MSKCKKNAKPFVTKKTENSVLWTFAIEFLDEGKKILNFLRKGIAKNKSKRFSDRKSNKAKIYLKWKNYDNLFNS